MADGGGVEAVDGGYDHEVEGSPEVGEAKGLKGRNIGIEVAQEFAYGAHLANGGV